MEDPATYFAVSKAVGVGLQQFKRFLDHCRTRTFCLVHLHFVTSAIGGESPVAQPRIFIHRFSRLHHHPYCIGLMLVEKQVCLDYR